MSIDQSGIDVVKTIADLGGFGLVSWIVYYVFKTLLPKLIADFDRMLDRQRESHEREMQSQRADFRQELGQQRQEFREEIARERAALDRVMDLFKRQ
jgi:hypothetical protein